MTLTLIISQKIRNLSLYIIIDHIKVQELLKNHSHKAVYIQELFDLKYSINIKTIILKQFFNCFCENPSFFTARF